MAYNGIQDLQVADAPVWTKAVKEAQSLLESYTQLEVGTSARVQNWNQNPDVKACEQNTQAVNYMKDFVAKTPKTEAEIAARFLPSPPALPGTMSQAEYLRRFEKVLKEMLETTRTKNSDYAGSTDAFKNFRAVELARPQFSTKDGIWVRMTDKWTRLCTLLDKPPLVVAESLQDTLTDLAVYAIILRIWEDFRGEGQVVKGA